MNKKKIYSALSILLLTSAIAFTSCKKDKVDEKEPATKGTATAVVKYDDKTINFSSEKDSSVAFLEWIETEKKHNFSMILKDDATGMMLVLMIYPAKEGTGTYPLEGLSADSWSTANVFLKGRTSSDGDRYGYVWISHNGDLIESKGTMTIASMTDKNVKGTFSATLYNYNDATKVSKKLSVTGGSFDVPLLKRDFDFSNIP